MTSGYLKFSANSFLPWLALGPISGLIAWRMYRCVRAGDNALAGLYGILFIAFWIGLSASGGQALAYLAQ